MRSQVSSVLRTVNYLRSHRRLIVTFKSGAVYQYDQVPPEVFAQLMAAPSMGRYFTQVIRDREEYPCRKLAEPDAVRFAAAGINPQE